MKLTLTTLYGPAGEIGRWFFVTEAEATAACARLNETIKRPLVARFQTIELADPTPAVQANSHQDYAAN